MQKGLFCVKRVGLKTQGASLEDDCRTREESIVKEFMRKQRAKRELEHVKESVSSDASSITPCPCPRLIFLFASITCSYCIKVHSIPAASHILNELISHKTRLPFCALTPVFAMH